MAMRTEEYFRRRLRPLPRLHTHLRTTLDATRESHPQEQVISVEYLMLLAAIT